MEANGETVERDAFGHVKLDKINPGQWFASSFAPLLKADKVGVDRQPISDSRKHHISLDFTVRHLFLSFICVVSCSA